MDADLFRSLEMPGQNREEWFQCLLYMESYFRYRGITAPVIVEVGIHTNAQKAFWERLFEARHIGIDILDKYSKPEILGDSHDPATVEKLMAILPGGRADLVFIDGDHDFISVATDYELYSAFADTIVFHDINCIASVKQIWNDIQAADIQKKQYIFLEFKAWENQYCYGIGLAIKRCAPFPF